MLPAPFGGAYVQMSGAKQLLRKKTTSQRRRKKNKMENNRKEMSPEQMEQVSGGKGPGWSLKDLWPKIKSWFEGEEDDD